MTSTTTKRARSSTSAAPQPLPDPHLPMAAYPPAAAPQGALMPAALAALTLAIAHVWRKLWLFAVGALHLLFSSDRQWLAATPTAADDWDGGTRLKCVKAKRIVFVRHAESEWNVVFNRGLGWGALVRLVRALLREWLLLPTPDSVFVDSPLSRTGVRQARALFEDAALAGGRLLEVGNSRDAERAAVLQHLNAPTPNSIVVASNLRRAIDTARVASAARLETPGEALHVLSALQEIGRNIDTLAISDAYALKAQVLSSAVRGDGGALFNLSESHGNKAVLGCGRTRLEAFARWAMRQQADVIVVYGHSLWFRAFCQEYFPASVSHDAKRLKLANCGVVSFALEEYAAPAEVTKERVSECAPRYRIEPTSFLVVR